MDLIKLLGSEEESLIANDVAVKLSEDENVNKVVKLAINRSEVGLKKYGVTTCGADLTMIQWLRHLLEEQLDACIYTQAAISLLEKNQNVEFSETYCNFTDVEKEGLKK
jgi:hypothetical protein